MGTPVITVEGLSKYYRLGVIGRGTLREDISRWWARMRGKPDPYSRIGDEASLEHRGTQVCALDNIDLEVDEGEILGVIGRNGAGKSTLLKILSRITAPTSGRAVIKGRVGSLLEVGTGFHPELTGRENIYLNGAILGMRRAEVTRKLEEIVDFAEVARFLDTPVKRYSSGMMVRLAFAVAAHLDPEIMIVDEVLAVGDVGFQNKCLGKMQDATTKESRTVVFVSHNMASVEALCNRAVVVDHGRITFSGNVGTAITRYSEDSFESQTTPLELRKDRTGTGVIRLTDCYFTEQSGRKLSSITTGKDISVHLPYIAEGGLRSVRLAFNFYEHTGNILMNFSCADSVGEFSNIPESGEFVCTIPRFPLRQGRYYGNIFCEANHHISDWVERAFAVDVVDGDYFGTGRLPSQGRYVADNRWRLQTTNDSVYKLE